MIGRAQTHGAISIVNALFDGIGGAVGIELPMDIEVESTGPGASSDSVVVEPDSANTPVVRGFLAALDRTGRSGGLRVQIHSEIPPCCGLKSSSALATGLGLALSQMQGRTLSPEGAAREGARISRASGQSATGAFEDCLASVLPGIWITDNRDDEILRHDPVPDGWEVVLWIPPGHHAPSPELVDRFRSAPPGTSSRLAREGRTWEAMEQNGRAVEAALDLEPIGVEELRALGARGAGVSGLGPARAVVVPSDRAEAITDHLAARPGSVRRIGFLRSSPSKGVP